MTTRQTQFFYIRSIFIFSLITLTAVSTNAKAEKKPVDPGLDTKATLSAPSTTFEEKNGKVDFYAVGVPSMLKIHGNTEAMNGKLIQTADSVKGTFKIPMVTFITGLSLRDKHLKEKAFEVEKYPDAIFTLDSVQMPSDAAKSVPFKGKLNFHGVEKSVSGEVKFTRVDQSIQHEAKFDVKLSDFNIPTPEFAGMKIQDTVKVEVNGKASSHL